MPNLNIAGTVHVDFSTRTILINQEEVRTYNGLSDAQFAKILTIFERRRFQLAVQNAPHNFALLMGNARREQDDEKMREDGPISRFAT